MLKKNRLKIKIIGAGSAGNHIAFAFKKFNAEIIMQDIDNLSLKRSKSKIYIQRYGKWDNNIRLVLTDDKKNKYDCIIISTPPDTHIEILKKNLSQSNIFLIEKPICEPNIKTIKKLKKIILLNKEKKIMCGYNHRLFPSTKKFKSILNKQKNSLNYLNINFKENTAGFLKAHSWYKDLSESYLSNQKKGGGSLSEHSHALNLAQYFLGDSNKLKLKFKFIKYFKSEQSFYDSNSSIFFQTNNKIIEVNQNFETTPTEKSVIADGKNFFLKLIYNFYKNNDCILYINKKTKSKKKFIFRKKRSDDFKYEADYLYKIITSNNIVSKEKLSLLDAGPAIQTIENIYKLIKD